MKIGNREFEFGQNTYVMGILNVTPDSFSDGGRYDVLSRAIEHAGKMIQSGVDIIDIGGESTRPGYTMISAEEEIERIVPVITAIKERWDIPISVDTYKAEVVKQAAKAGADMINDIWGLKFEPSMPMVVKETNLPICLMHNRPEIKDSDILLDIIQELGESIGLALEAGIANDKIIVDPGVGFGKSYEQNLRVLANLQVMHQFGYPVLLGCSRKSVIGLTMNLPAEEREEGTMVTSVYAVQHGCSFVRVHDVLKNKRAIEMTKALQNAAK